jgi:glucose/arabinose dehydrogenase
MRNNILSVTRRNHPESRCRLQVELLETRDCPATLFDPELDVRTAIGGLSLPTGLAFIGHSDLLITEKATGMVKRFTNGVPNGVVLDLAVNFASERGLLGIELHPNFAQNGYVYLFWTESTTGTDTGVLSETSLLGNRVDRFRWNGTNLIHDLHIISLRALQPAFAAEPTPAAGRGNHDGGKIKFGPDGKLYVMIGDVGRRGQMQNLPDGPFGQGLADDQFGGPTPGDAHLTGVILRLNDDGTTPRDNPFFRAGEVWGGSAGANLQKVFAYGLRNGFGMAFDPYSGRLWEAQNGDDSFSEINRVEGGDNLGWVQVMGPLSRVGEFREIETTPPFRGLQQARWSPDNIAATPEEALARMFQVIQDAHHFSATMTGAEEVPAVSTAAAATIDVQLTGRGTLRFQMRATADIVGATQAHFHIAARGQNGPVVAFLLPFDPAGKNFRRGQIIAQGELTDADLIARPGFQNPTISELVSRMLQGRVYVNLHTVAHPPGEVRGQMIPQGRQVSRYSDPEFSWKFEVAPVGLGFLQGRALGRKYEGSLFVGQAVPGPLGGRLFRFDLTPNRKELRFTDPRLTDKVADNTAKFELTESESLLFGEGFGIAAEILTGPNGNLFVLSLSDGVLYEIYRPGASGGGAILAPSLVADEPAAPVPTPAVPDAAVRPVRAAGVAAEFAEHGDVRRPDGTGSTIVVRSGTAEGFRPGVADDDLLAFDPIAID